MKGTLYGINFTGDTLHCCIKRYVILHDYDKRENRVPTVVG